jgi:hypothetical protein
MAYRVTKFNNSGTDVNVLGECVPLPLFGYRYEHDEFLLYQEYQRLVQEPFPMTKFIAQTWGRGGLCSVTVSMAKWILRQSSIPDYTAQQVKQLQENTMRFLAQEPTTTINLSGFDIGWLFAGSVDQLAY